MSLRSPGARRDPSRRAVTGKAPRPGDMTERQRRAAAQELSDKQRAKPDLERVLCEVCLRYVRLRNDGSIAGHQASRGISCAGATPTF